MLIPIKITSILYVRLYLVCSLKINAYILSQLKQRCLNLLKTVILQVPIIHDFSVEPCRGRDERNQYNFAMKQNRVL